MNIRTLSLTTAMLAALTLTACLTRAQAVPDKDKDVDKWVTVTGEAAGVDANAKDEATKAALRKGVEEACGVFIKSQSKVKDYQTVYDKILANTVGFVAEYSVSKTVVDDKAKTTAVTVKARVSTKKFEENWAVIAHTIQQENNPRVVFAIAEATQWTTTGPAYTTDENGTVQTKIEDFFITKGVKLMDRSTASKVNKRDLLLASIKDDASEIAALGARFNADVVIVGQATVKFGKEIVVEDTKMYQYVTTLNVRVIQCDSAAVLASKSFGLTTTSLQKGGADDKAMAKLGDDAAPKLLEAVIDAWAKRANVSRTVQLSISGMDYDAFKTFKAAAEKIRGVQAVRMREITEEVANIDVEYQFTNENLADRLTELKELKLKITEITANRIKIKIEK